MSVIEAISMMSESGYSDRELLKYIDKRYDEIECELNGEEYKEPKKRDRYFCMDCKLRKTVDYERSILTWTTDEVNKAIEKGYKVLKTYEVWHFDKSTDALFKGYIRRFMKIKLESSNYDFKTKEEEVSFKARIKDSLDIDIEKFEFNAGLRSIAKLCLNSLWGSLAKDPICHKLNT